MHIPGLTGRYFTVAAFSAILVLGVLFVSVSHIRAPILYQPKSTQTCPTTTPLGSDALIPPSPPPYTNKNKTAAEDTDNGGKEWEFVVERDGDNYGLSRGQCQKAFPKLFLEIEKAVVARQGRKITFDEINSKPLKRSMVRAMIYQGELYVIGFEDMKYTFTRAKASLNALNRALSAIPNREEIPNVEFIFTSEDYHDEPDPVWVYSKRETDTWAWLMPDFGYWSWPEIKAGQYRNVRKRIAAVDEGSVINGKETPGLKFQDKQKQLLWRGNIATMPELRGKLLEVTQGKPWSSVRPLEWGNEESIRNDYVALEDHCRYMFLAHVEGRSYSGRGKYIQNCRSVFIAHQLTWREAHHAALVATGPDANYVKVQRDFSDLEKKINYLLDNPDVAEKIAENSIKTFRDLYLTPAAEACYWRELVHAYASMCDFEPVLYQDSMDNNNIRGFPFESFVLNWNLPS
ncbi:hypothetical protein FQN51_002560 [Onygenales sp. PD_10]|nr:hypothetical protein FQN51_002560 [Onygenales sp. PD_10]